MDKMLSEMAGKAIAEVLEKELPALLGMKKHVYAMGKPHRKPRKIKFHGILWLMAIFPIGRDRALIRVRKPFRSNLLNILFFVKLRDVFTPKPHF